MPRAIWSGSIGFGLVNVPVKAFAASRDHKVHFREITTSGSTVKHQKVSAKTGKPVEEIQLGYETSKDHFVPFSPDELETLRPESTRAIEISDFVDLAAIDPIFYAHTYWLAPADDSARKAYDLLAGAMDNRQRVGIGTVVMRRTQYLAAVRPVGPALALSTMRFADEVVPSSSIDGIPARRTKLAPKELAMAGQIIDALASDWKPERYHDTYTEELRKLIKRKAKGEAITAEAEPERHAPVVDLSEALRASLEATTKRRGTSRRKAS